MAAPPGFRRHCAELFRRLGEGEGSWRHAAYLRDKNLVVRVTHISSDVMEFDFVECSRDYIRIEMQFPGALSRVESRGNSVQIDFLKSLLASNYTLKNGGFAVKDDMLVFTVTIPFREVGRIVLGPGEVMDYDAVAGKAVDAAVFIMTAVPLWLEDALKNLERGGGVEPLDLEREAERVEKGSGGALDPLVVAILQR